jgi:hypothetical protein
MREFGASDGETRTRTGDTTIFRRGSKCLYPMRNGWRPSLRPRIVDYMRRAQLPGVAVGESCAFSGGRSSIDVVESLERSDTAAREVADLARQLAAYAQRSGPWGSTASAPR